MKEHQDACEGGMLEKSAAAEHTSVKHYPIKLEDTAIQAQARGYKELRLKEAFQIRWIPVGNLLKHDLRLELQNCWEQASGSFRIKGHNKGPGPSL